MIDTAVLKALVGVNLALTLAVLAAVIGVFSMLVGMEHRLTALEDGQQLIIGLLKARP